ncbi:MAG: lipocalin family protein [Gammaproteobacteria bacterium]|nr:lipocalin family protein [Gammaproteobacteria bacterium]
MRTYLVLLLAVAVLAVLASRAQAREPELVSKASVDLDRYMGRWWVIGNIPYFAERGKIASADVYALRPDGKIDNVFVYRKAFDKPEKRMNALATVVPGSNNTRWKIAFFGGLLKADYLVLEVAPDYSWALIGQPSGKLAWVFSREQRMDDAQFDALREKFAAYGYRPGDIKRVPQFPDQQK